jgi:hypothetical protein
MLMSFMHVYLLGTPHTSDLQVTGKYYQKFEPSHHTLNLLVHNAQKRSYSTSSHTNIQIGGFSHPLPALGQPEATCWSSGNTAREHFTLHHQEGRGLSHK